MATALKEETWPSKEAGVTTSFQSAEQDPQRWWVSSEAYHALIEAGAFRGVRVELVGGEILQMNAFLPPHVIAQSKTYERLLDALRPRFVVRSEAPLSLANGDHPEPDIAVVPGRHDDYARQHPSTAFLVVEVSDATLSYDRNRKASLYALAQIPDYWILNVTQRQLEVRREPREDTNAPFGFSYGSLQTLSESAFASPLCAPDVSLRVAELLPLTAITSE